MTVGQCQAGIDQKAVAVLHQPMPEEAELRLLAFALLVEPCLRIGGRGMRIVRPLLAMEIRLGVAPAASSGRFTRTVFGPLTLFIDAQASISVPSTEK